MPKGPIINLRYESAAQVQKFKRAAKLCRWSLNTFVLVAADNFAREVLSSKEAPQAPTQAPEYIPQPSE